MMLDGPWNTSNTVEIDFILVAADLLRPRGVAGEQVARGESGGEGEWVEWKGFFLDEQLDYHRPFESRGFVI